LSCVAYAGLLFVALLGWERALPSPAQVVVDDARSLSVNVLASFVLYYLIAYLPAQRRRALIRDSCKSEYRYAKRSLLYDILSASWKGGRKDIDFSSDTLERLLDPSEFRILFEHGREADEGFYAFSNHIQSNESDFREIIFKFGLIARQISFVLNNLDDLNEETFSTLRRLEDYLWRLDLLHADYDDEKQLSNAIWAIFAGWSMAEGYLGYDPVEKAIAAI
jgi:hypothetical protein